MYMMYWRGVVFFIVCIYMCETFSSAIINGLRPFPHLSKHMHIQEDPEVYMNATELIRSKGYPEESYTAITEDGFLLTVHRIPYGIKNKTFPRPPIFVMHGLLCSSTNWLTNLVNESLGFLLADAGYDVWMGNARGNTYSRRHVEFVPSQEEFWQWSWQEMARFDLPAMIDLVLDKTGYSQVYYASHSQGAMMAFGHLAQNPQFNKKIKVHFGMGPVATVGHIKGPLRLLALFAWEFDFLFELLGTGEFLPNDEIMKWLATNVCDEVTRILCSDILFVIAGFDQNQLNKTRLPVYISHTPAGTSVRNMVHFAQMVNSGKFQMYNYGCAEKNRAHYGVPQPPLYNISQVTVPTILFSSDNDLLADPTDVMYLEKYLPNLMKSYILKEWDHLDFIWAMDSAPLVYDKIINIMNRIEQGEITL